VSSVRAEKGFYAETHVTLARTMRRDRHTGQGALNSYYHQLAVWNFLPPLVIAHRGASAYEPENTLRAFDLAIKQGAQMIELDLHVTCDNHVRSEERRVGK